MHRVIEKILRMSAYQSSWDHLSEELKGLALRLYVQVLQSHDPLRQYEPEASSVAPEVWEELKGLVSTEREIIDLLSGLMGLAPDTPMPDLRDSADLTRLFKEIDREIENKRKAAQEKAAQENKICLTLPCLSRLFQLSRFEEQALLLCFAPELDRKYERVYGYLHDDITLTEPTVDLVLRLLCDSEGEKVEKRACFSADAPLLKYQLLEWNTESKESPASLLSHRLRISRRIVNFLLEAQTLDERVAAFAALVGTRRCGVEVRWEQVQTAQDQKKKLRALTKQYLNREKESDKGNHLLGKELIYLFQGSYGTAKKETAEALCQEFELPLIRADVERMVNGKLPFEEAVWLLFREAELQSVFREGQLQSAAVYLEGFERLIEAESHSVNLAALVAAFESFSSLTFLDTETPWEPVDAFNLHLFETIEFPRPEYPLRRKWWAETLAGSALTVSTEVDAEDLANKFRFTPGQIRNVVIKAKSIALLRDAETQELRVDDLYAACRAKSNPNLGRLTQKIEPKYQLEDIVLPADQRAQLIEICNCVEHRPLVYNDWGFERKLSLGKGINALFSGPSGTGKTMAAEIIANQLHLDLYKIDLSQVVSKYIGETEKNLNQIFTEAQSSNAILLFDEADALFGKRSEVKDAHDRYANIEIGYLLQKMEEYEGITILTTNLRKNMDEAFVRRLRFQVDFPFPDAEDRKEIWMRSFPCESPKGPNIDFEFLAKQFKITGGNIKNIVLCAAFLAAAEKPRASEDGKEKEPGARKIRMKHLIRGVKREFQKMEKLCVAEDFGEYYHLLTENDNRRSVP